MYTVSSLVNNKKVPNESVALLALNTRCKKKLENMRMSSQYDIKEKCKTTENWKNQD